MSKKEQQLYYNNMVCPIKALEGDYTIVDFRNECSIYGKIDNVDGFMNIEMEDCIFNDPKGNNYQFPTFYVKARTIRYVHVPKEYRMEDLINAQLGNMVRRRDPKQRTFKAKRAERYQAEIVAEISKSQNLPKPE